MKIRADMLDSAINEYIDEVFNGLQFNTVNVLNKIGAKIKAKQFIKPIVDALGDEKGMIDITMLEDMAMPELRKLGSIEVPAMGTKYTFKESDFINFFNKLKEKSNDE